jgi:uroporphyrinogen-III synthase
MTTTNHTSPLKNITCLITRPRHQAQQLIMLLNKAGARCILFPSIDIKTLPLDRKATSQSLTQANKAIFVSANAVIPKLKLPEDTTAFAIGPGTQKALAQYDIQAITPENKQFNSEGLLAHPLLQQITGQDIVIFCGKGGRTTLSGTLQQRGAKVEKIEIYERIKPNSIMDGLEKENIDWVISTSSESLQNLWEIAGETHQPWLAKQRLLVISPKMQTLAHDLGFAQPTLVAVNASDMAIIEALSDWQQKSSDKNPIEQR